MKSCRPSITYLSLGFLVAALGSSPGLSRAFPARDSPGEDRFFATFSIAAVDPENGVCGAAVASRYPAVGKAVAFARAGVGAFCTQHWNNSKFAEPALDMLEKGKLPEEVLAELLREDKMRD